jgi:hypothetical protein
MTIVSPFRDSYNNQPMAFASARYLNTAGWLHTTNEYERVSFATAFQAYDRNTAAVGSGIQSVDVIQTGFSDPGVC